ncbi:MAG TPA: pyridoxal phosphate-dependent aminotransferase, partial [Polyangiales bacterium]
AMPPFARRAEVTETANAFTEALAEARARAEPLFDLSSGNPTEQGLGLTESQLRTLLVPPGSASYQPAPFGMWSARAAHARDLALRGLKVDPAQIMLTASTSEAYAFLFKLLCDPGDALLVPEPSYPLLDVLARVEGVELVRYALRYDGEWHVDPASLRAGLTRAGQGARAIVSVNPNNPTGSFLKRDELALLAGTGLPLVSDEVFADYALSRPPALPSVLANPHEQLVFRLSGLSKELALPQLKLAFTCIAGPEPLVRAACARLEHIADAYLSPATPVQLALPALLERRPSVQGEILARLRQNQATLRRALANSCATPLHVEGGWYAVVRLPDVMSDEALCLELLTSRRVIAQPGYFFDLPDAHAVVSLIVRPESFAEGCTRLRALLDELG